MKKVNVLLLILSFSGIYLLTSCGPNCKECQVNSELGISISMGELCDEDLEKAVKTPNVSCR